MSGKYGQDWRRLSPEDIALFTVFQSTCTEGGGICRASSPYCGGGRDVGVTETMREVGRHMSRLSPCIRDTVPSTGWPTVSGDTLESRNGVFAASSSDGEREYIHITAMPTDGVVCLPAPVNDAVFNRNAAVEAAYDCAVEEYKLRIDDAKNELIRATQAGDASIDLATMYFLCGWIAERAMSGAFIDLGSLDSVNLSNPWYDQNSVGDFTVMGKTFFVVSSLTIGDRIATAGMVFNKQLYEDYQLASDYGSLCDLVRKGKWTHEALSSMVLSLSEDVNGDGKMTADDFYGLLYERDSLVSFFNSYGMRVATPDDDGLPVFSLVTDENANKLDATFDFLYHKDNCFHVMNRFDGLGTNFTTGMTNMFKNNQAMYMWIRFADVELLRTMDVDFGILPVPKWDEAQDQYYNTVNEYMGVGTVIPVSCGDPEMTGTFIEAISCESMKQLIPAYYDVVLQGKISRDVESTEMLDLIFSNRVYDIGMIFNIGGFGGTVYGMTRTYDASYATLWAKNQKRFSKEMERFVKKWESIGE